MNLELEIGSRVRLSPDTVWNANTRSNPLGHLGTVVEDVSIDGWVYVEWDNGLRNAYRGKDGDLIRVDK